jgi:hypothetical protein
MMLKTPVDCDISEVWLKGIYKAIWEAAPDVEQEPVGYELRIRMLPDGDFDSWTRCNKKSYEFCKENPTEGTWEYEVRALYTNPQPKREPLSDDELNSLRQRDNGKLNFVTLREFREVARAIEKAHGIGVEQ